MLDTALRPVKDRLLRPLAAPLAGRVHPNLLSTAGGVAGVAAALLLARGAYGAGLALWAACRLLDGLDGEVARLGGRQSDFGGYLDILLDFLVYAAVPIGLVTGRPESAELHRALALLLASFYLNAASWMYLSALLEKRGGERPLGEVTSVRMPRGLVEGTETVLLYTLFILFPESLVALFTLMAALVAATVAQRLLWAASRL